MGLRRHPLAVRPHPLPGHFGWTISCWHFFLSLQLGFEQSNLVHHIGKITKGTEKVRKHRETRKGAASRVSTSSRRAARREIAAFSVSETIDTACLSSNSTENCDINEATRPSCVCLSAPSQFQHCFRRGESILDSSIKKSWQVNSSILNWTSIVATPIGKWYKW